MGLTDYISTNWAVIAANPLPFIIVAIICASIGWAAGRFMYGERITMLKERISARDEKLAALGNASSSPVPEQSGRTLTAAQMQKLANSIATSGIDLSALSIIFSTHGGDEARRYAEQIAAVFAAHGWRGEIGAPFDDDHRLTGVKIWYQPGAEKDPNAMGLAKVLHTAGIDYEWTPHEPPYSGAVLFVYRKDD
jgi:hypothetical protein